MFQLNLGLWLKIPAGVKPVPTRVPGTDSFPWKHGITVQTIRNPRARRYLLRLQADGSARLVIPGRGSRAEGLRFLERSEAWLLKRHAQWKSREKNHKADLPWTDGHRFLFRGEEMTLRVEPVRENIRLSFGDQMIESARSLSDYRAIIMAHLRHLAEQELPVRTRELAQIHNVVVNRITVRAQKSRWGSCSSRGTISLNWRIIQAPPEVRDYLIIHELMHRREMNHSARYWKLVAAACPGYESAERWLKQARWA
jgi:predicted metal-dependent hydrolase